MAECYSPFVIYEEKNPRKFSIEIENQNYIGLTHPKFEVDKVINFLEEEKPSNNYTQNKSSSFSTNIFLISNIKENTPNENKLSQFSENTINYQNILEEKQKISYISKENENSDSNNEYHSGRWTNEEHDKFIEGILKYGNEWKRVQSIIKTRSSTQARSHAQKFFLRMKKEINPKNLSNQELLLQYIINSTTYKSKNYTQLSPEQKERLFSVIRSNLKTEESQNRSNNNQNYNKNKDGELGIEYINEEEDDNLGYNKENIFNKKNTINDNGEKKKITFCSKKRKNTNELYLSTNENKIFTIKKDINKRSMDITKSSDNFVNNMTKDNPELKKIPNDVKNNINNNNKYINNNKSGNINNFIIQNNYYNIINNFNNVKNQGNLSFNINNNPTNILQNNIFSTYFNNDSINSDINIHNNKFCHKEKNSKNNIIAESLEYEKNNLNLKNPLDNYPFLNNENFFPNLNKNNQYDNYNKNYDNIEQNDPFNLKFENVIVHNEHNDNNTIINDNLYLNNNINIEEAHDNDDSEFDRINFGRNNNISDKPYDD